jgi:hypothetical protein
MLQAKPIEIHSALRTVLRIKAGLSPLGRISELTIDLPRQLAFLKRVYADAARSGGPALVIGPYGSGKTHFLQLAKEYALKQGFAFAQLSQDTGLASLAHPQRHLSTLIKSLSASSPYGNLLDWLGNAIEIPEHLNAFSVLLHQIRDEQPEQTEIIDVLLAALALPKEYRTTALVAFLSGSLLTGKTAHPSTRAEAYRLLRFWLCLCQKMFHCRGLILLIDELENLYTNAVCWNILSRRAAYRTLSFYATGLFPSVMLCTLTPDGHTRLMSEMNYERNFLVNSASHLMVENIEAFIDAIIKTPPYELSPLKPREYAVLGERLTALHAEARGYSGSQRFTFPQVSPGMTPRIFSKSVISILESRWFETARSQ